MREGGKQDKVDGKHQARCHLGLSLSLAWSLAKERVGCLQWSKYASLNGEGMQPKGSMAFIGFPQNHGSEILRTNIPSRWWRYTILVSETDGEKHQQHLPSTIAVMMVWEGQPVGASRTQGSVEHVVSYWMTVWWCDDSFPNCRWWWVTAFLDIDNWGTLSTNSTYKWSLPGLKSISTWFHFVMLSAVLEF